MNNSLKWIEISEKNLIHNIAEARKYIGDKVELSAVIKANAYGHGAGVIADRLESSSDVNSFSVVNIEEAEELRSVGIRKPIVVLGYFTSHECPLIVELDVIPFVYSMPLLDYLNRAAKFAGKIVRVIVKVETGMGRLGEKGEALISLLEYITNCTNIEIAGFATHFAQSDSESAEKTTGQISLFQSFLADNQNMLTDPQMSCTANTGGIFLYPDSHFDMVRFGIGLYGFYPSEFVKISCRNALLPILEYKTRIVHIQNIKRGESVSYGSTWKADKDTVIAVLPVGYADGYRRAFSNRASVLIDGKRAPVRGRVCMDLTMVDVSEIENIHLDKEVALVSSEMNSGCSVEDLAEIADTINYEITTMLPAHIPRVLV